MVLLFMYLVDIVMVKRYLVSQNSQRKHGLILATWNKLVSDIEPLQIAVVSMLLVDIMHICMFSS